ncbi:hypothetical protein AYO44_10030 [Planctomycetaceae bacterium SCGC AG-212-F19]|nr:hypothetical protein AYO44_10030 [Planctomycetaceae bacterium SCGC AG-212-F19]
MFGRLACLVLAFAITGGTVWFLSANAVNQGPVQPPAAAVPRTPQPAAAAPASREFAPKAPPAADEPSPVVKEPVPAKPMEPDLEPPPAPVAKEPKDPKPDPAEPDKAGPPPAKRLVLEVDLSKLPPDLVKQLQGAIIKRDSGKAPQPPDGKQPPEKKP